MDYLDYLDIGSLLPDLPAWSTAVQSASQAGLDQLLQIDRLYLVVAGCFLLVSVLVTIALKKWKVRQTQEPQTKSHKKHKEKPRGIENIKHEETDKSKTNKWKRPDSKTSPQESEGNSKSTWFGGITEKLTSLNKEKSPNTEDTNKTDEKKKGWFTFPKEEVSKQAKSKSNVAESRDSFMRPINLNIDRDAQPQEVSKKKKENELQLVRKMCGEFREVVKLDNKDDREEKRKEMEKVRSARSYFKTADKYRSESLSGNPRIRFRTEDDFNDSYSRGNQKRLSQFTPGKINSRFTDLFEGEHIDRDVKPQKPPKKKIMTLDQVMKKGSPKTDEGKIRKEMELDELKQSGYGKQQSKWIRKQWETPEVQKNYSTSIEKDEILSLQSHTTPVKMRWNPTDSSKKVISKSLEIPNKLNIEQVFPNTEKDDDGNSKIEVEKELDELRLSRPNRFQKIGREERSSSAHVLQRVKLPDDSWVVEKSESRILEERMRANEEIELVKQARLETLEALENMELERPSSRVEDQSRFEAMKELDEVRRARTVTLQDDEVRSEVIKIVENQLNQDPKVMHDPRDGVSNQITGEEDTKVTHDPDDDVYNQINTEEDTKDGVSNQITAEEDTQITHDPDGDVSYQMNNKEDTKDCVSNQVIAEEDSTVTNDPDDDVSNQINTEEDTKVTLETNDDNHRLRSGQVNLKAKELAMLAMELENETDGEALEHQDTQEQLQERLSELTELADCRSLDIAMAIAAEGVLEFEGLKGTQVSVAENDDSGLVDEDFEQRKKMIEDEFRLIEEQYKAVQEQENSNNQSCEDVVKENEEINTAEAYEELTERLLKVAQSIQESAKSLGSEEIDLSPRIDRIQLLRDECQVANQSIQVQDNNDKKVTTEKEEKHNQESIKPEGDEHLDVEMNCVPQMIDVSNQIIIEEHTEETNDPDDEVCNQITTKEDMKATKQISTEEEAKVTDDPDDDVSIQVTTLEDAKLTPVPDDDDQITTQEGIKITLDPDDQDSIKSDGDVKENCVPQLTENPSNNSKPRDEQKKDMAQFERAKINKKFKNIFEDMKGTAEDIQVRRQPKKKLITLDQILIKSSSQDINHEKEIELEIVKNLRKNWLPPEDSDVEASKTRLEPKKLKIDHVYGNDSKGGTEQIKIERENELEEVRQSNTLAARWRSETPGDTKEDKRPRPRSAMKVTQSDDFWLKEKPDAKVEEDKLKVFHEIETIKQARLKFEDEPISRHENDARQSTLQELENLRSNQSKMDSSVRKIKRDLEEINKNVADREKFDRPNLENIQTNTTQQWSHEREIIKESFSAKLESEQDIKPGTTNKIKWNDSAVIGIPEKEITSVEHDVKKADDATTVEDNVKKADPASTVEDKVKSKLKEIKSLDVFKQKDKTSKKNETERGRRELKNTETKEGTSLRSKSISTLKNAGQKIKNLTNEKLKNVMKTKAVDDDHENLKNTEE